MKKILLISAAMLFSVAIFAQSPEMIPNRPHFTCNLGNMFPDCFPPSMSAKTKCIPSPVVIQGPNAQKAEYMTEKMKPDAPETPKVYPHTNRMLPY